MGDDRPLGSGSSQEMDGAVLSAHGRSDATRALRVVTERPQGICRLMPR